MHAVTHAPDGRSNVSQRDDLSALLHPRRRPTTRGFSNMSRFDPSVMRIERTARGAPGLVRDRTGLPNPPNQPGALLTWTPSLDVCSRRPAPMAVRGDRQAGPTSSTAKSLADVCVIAVCSAGPPVRSRAPRSRRVAQVRAAAIRTTFRAARPLRALKGNGAAGRSRKPVWVAQGLASHLEGSSGRGISAIC